MLDAKLWRSALELQSGEGEAAEKTKKAGRKFQEDLAVVGQELRSRGMLLPGEDPEWDSQREEAELELMGEGFPLPREELGAHLRPAIALTPHPEESDSHGQLAGAPYWPAEEAWPSREGRPLVMVLQLNLARLPARLQRLSGLPGEGRLTLFHDLLQLDEGEGGWGEWPADLGASLLRIYSPEEACSRAELPEGIPEWYREPSYLSSHPFADLTPVQEVLLASGEDENYEKADQLQNRAYSSKLLGVPDPIQGPVEEECPLAKRDPDPPAGQPDLRQKESRDWRLLLQLDELGPFTWGDSGLLYVMMPAESLLEGGTECWTIMQCC